MKQNKKRKKRKNIINPGQLFSWRPCCSVFQLVFQLLVVRIEKCHIITVSDTRIGHVRFVGFD